MGNSSIRVCSVNEFVEKWSIQQNFFFLRSDIHLCLPLLFRQHCHIQMIPGSCSMGSICIRCRSRNFSGSSQAQKELPRLQNFLFVRLKRLPGFREEFPLSMHMQESVQAACLGSITLIRPPVSFFPLNLVFYKSFYASLILSCKCNLYSSSSF